MRLIRWGLLLPTLGLAFGLACAKPTKVTVTPKQVVFNDSGASKTLQAAVFDQKDRPMEKAKVAFASSAPDVAEVDATGKVTVRGSGETVITATSGKAVGEAKVIVHIVNSLNLVAPDSGVSGPAGDTASLQIESRNEKGEPADLSGIVFNSSAPAVATVDNTGKLTLLTSGQTTVEATIGKTKASVPVDVHVLVPMAIKVPTPPVQNIQVGETAKLDVSVLSDAGSPMKFPFTCSSSSEAVATVDKDGNVTGVARGTAEITVMAGTAKNTIKVVVK